MGSRFLDKMLRIVVEHFWEMSSGTGEVLHESGVVGANKALGDGDIVRRLG